MIQFNMSQTIKISSILNILVREKKKKNREQYEREYIL